jgi:LPXTG-motif cell wall-anchored protein
MPSARRLLTLGGVAFVGLAATALFAAPASAHIAAVSGDSKCASDGTYTIHWTIDNKYRQVDVKLTDVKPAGTKLEGVTIKGGAVLEFDQTGIPGDTKGDVTLSFTAVWKDGWNDTGNPHSGTVTLKGKCKPECPPSVDTKGGHPKPPPSCPPSESPSPSGGTGGGEGSPTPSKSNTSPSLPVTGAQTGLYAGGAMVLLGAGAGLFFVARRRRVKFEA